MASVLNSAKLTAQLTWNFADQLPLGNTVNANQASKTINLTNGTGAGNANAIYTRQVVLAPGTTMGIDIDLFNVNNFVGEPVSFNTVKLLYVELTTITGASGIAVGNGGDYADPWLTWMTDPANISAAVKVLAGGVFALGGPTAAGYPVETGQEVLYIYNLDATASATINVGIVGVDN